MEWYNRIKEQDPEIFEYLKGELERKRTGLELIPSENFTSEAVLQALGSILTDKYSEGYPGRRYYGGNKFIDKIEVLAQERAKKLFGVPYANVQPHSGSPANFAVYFAVCSVGDTIMGLNFPDGGHLTHGFKTSISGQIFRSVPYHTNPEGYIDIEEARRLAEENKPKLIWIGATAYSRALPFREFAEISESVGAYLAADIAHIAGLVAAGVHESPVDYAHIVTTTTHKTLRGPRGGLIMVTRKGLDKDSELGAKIDKAIIPGMQGGPHNHQTAAIAIALEEASKPEFKTYATQVVRNAKVLSEELIKGGQKIVTNGTDNHLMLMDFTPLGKGMGLFAEQVLDVAGITVNRNAIPREPMNAFYPSGVRLGTPPVTSRGMKEAEMRTIGRFICDALQEIKKYSLPEKETRTAYISNFTEEIKENGNLIRIRQDVAELCEKFPIYPDMAV